MGDNFSTNLKMLIVEDDLENKNLYRFLFRRSFQITFCNTANEAILSLQENFFNVIIVDLGLPGNKNGLELIKEFRAIPEYANIPIICVTAFVQFRDRQLALEAGANTFLTKPLRNEVIIDYVNELTQS